MSKPTYYAFFGLKDFEDDQAKIKSAYRSMMLKWHPDRHQTDKTHAEYMAKQVNEVYRVLSTCKISYDQHLRQKMGTTQEGPFTKAGREYTYRYSPFGAKAGDPIFDFKFDDMEEIMKRHGYASDFNCKSAYQVPTDGPQATRKLRARLMAEMYDLTYKELDQVDYFIRGLKMGRPK